MDELNRTAEKCYRDGASVRNHTNWSWPCTDGTLYNIKNGATLAKKLANDTARVVCYLISHIATTGYAATLISTTTKITPHRALPDIRPRIKGCDQGSCSVDFRDSPSNRHPTVKMSVNDPKKSIRLNLVRRGRERTSSGSGVLTLIETSIIDIARMGTCNLLRICGYCKT